MGMLSEWWERRRVEHVAGVAARWWHAQDNGRAPAWAVLLDPHHQAVVDGIVDGFWTAMEQPAADLSTLAQRLADWDRSVAQTLRTVVVPTTVHRLVQSWRVSTAPGDAGAIEQVLKQHTTASTKLALPVRLGLSHRHADWEAGWRDGVARFGYAAITSDLSDALPHWSNVQRCWREAHAETARRLDEPDASMGAQRWIAKIGERSNNVDAAYDPVARTIALSMSSPAAMGDQALDATHGWVRHLAHERGHALDFALGELCASPVDPQRVLEHGFAMREQPDEKQDLDPLAGLIPTAPFSTRQDPLNGWMARMKQSLAFVNACVNADGDTAYLMRSGEMTARFWEGRVDPRAREDDLSPMRWMPDDEQRRLREALLCMAGLSLHRTPMMVPTVHDVRERLDQQVVHPTRLDVTHGPDNRTVSRRPLPKP